MALLSGAGVWNKFWALLVSEREVSKYKICDWRANRASDVWTILDEQFSLNFEELIPISGEEGGTVFRTLAPCRLQPRFRANLDFPLRHTDRILAVSIFLMHLARIRRI